MAPTTFFSLPAELRSAIYLDSINATPKGILALKPAQSTHTKPSQPQVRHPLSLLRASKQTHAETLPILLATHKIRIALESWPRILSMPENQLQSIRYLIIDNPSTLRHASRLPALTTLDIRVPDFRFAKSKSFLSNGFPSLQRLFVSDPKLKAMAEHFALEDGEQTLPRLSWCVYSVEDFQTWRKCWALRKVDRELRERVEGRMGEMVVRRLF